MTTSTIVPEVIDENLTQILEDSPMTDSEEKEFVIVKTAIKTAYVDKVERDLAIGAGLLKIFQRKLYRGKDGGRSWSQWLAEESAELTTGRGPLKEDTAKYLRGFYRFRCEVLQPQGRCPDSIPLPTAPAQIRPLIAQLESHPDAAIEMWKAACSDAGYGKVPTFPQVERAALIYKADLSKQARRLSEAQQASNKIKLEKANAVQAANRGVANVSLNKPPSKPQVQPEPEPVKDFSPKPETKIPAWGLQKHDDSIDAGAECKQMVRTIYDAHRLLADLKSHLYNRINEYGSQYLDFLREIDAGAYSVDEIDDLIDGGIESLTYIKEELLHCEYAEGELSKKTVSVESFPER